MIMRDVVCHRVSSQSKSVVVTIFGDSNFYVSKGRKSASIDILAMFQINNRCSVLIRGKKQLTVP